MTIDEKQLTAMLSDPATQRKAFEMVVRQYSEQLYWQVRRIVLTHEDANDVMQNVMMKAWTNLDSFRKDSKLLPGFIVLPLMRALISYDGKKGLLLLVPMIPQVLPILFLQTAISMETRQRHSCRRQLPSCQKCSVQFSISVIMTR